MLDPKLLRHDPEGAERALARRGVTLDRDFLDRLEARRKALQTRTQTLQGERNRLSKAIGQRKATGGDTTALMAEVGGIGAALAVEEEALTALQSELEEFALSLPNLPQESVPDGADEQANVEIQRWGEPGHFEFTPRDHVDIGVQLGLLDFEAAALMSGARFVVLRGALARLQRALTQFMLDWHVARGYEEVYVPYLVEAQSLVGTGQLPKFAADLYQLSGSSLYLIPTAEVPVTNLARDRIFEVDDLPRRYVCHTPCFRSEAGAAGRDTRGMIRQHQFEKVELVQFVTPAQAPDAHQSLTADAESVLRALGLPYRVMNLCAGDLGFASSKTFDLEVWLPGSQKYREISSCSHFGDFQARRLKARFRPQAGAKPELIHTLNGSGLAVGRTLVAILENYQQTNGSVRIPEALRPYMGGLERLG